MPSASAQGNREAAAGAAGREILLGLYSSILVQKNFMPESPRADGNSRTSHSAAFTHEYDKWSARNWIRGSLKFKKGESVRDIISLVWELFFGLGISF